MTAKNKDRNEPDQPRRKGPGILKIMQSILAGALGVQSSKRREEDFSNSSPWPYIIAGVVFTAGFVITLIIVVKIVLAG